MEVLPPSSSKVLCLSPGSFGRSGLPNDGRSTDLQLVPLLLHIARLGLGVGFQ